MNAKNPKTARRLVRRYRRRTVREGPKRIFVPQHSYGRVNRAARNPRRGPSGAQKRFSGAHIRAQRHTRVAQHLRYQRTVQHRRVAEELRRFRLLAGPLPSPGELHRPPSFEQS